MRMSTSSGLMPGGGGGGGRGGDEGGAQGKGEAAPEYAVDLRAEAAGAPHKGGTRG